MLIKLGLGVPNVLNTLSYVFVIRLNGQDIVLNSQPVIKGA